MFMYIVNVAAYLMKYKSLLHRQAYNEVKLKRSQINLNSDQYKALIVYGKYLTYEKFNL